MRLRALDLALFGLDVRRHEELRKQHKERQDIHNVGRHDSESHMGALHGQEVTSLRHHGNKLHQLHHGKTRLPPNWKRLACFWNLGVHTNNCTSDAGGSSKKEREKFENLDVPTQGHSDSQ
jgi:hypothetical protein